MKRLLLPLALGIGLVFLALVIAEEAFVGRWAIKAAPIVLLAVWVGLQAQTPLARRVAAGLLVGSGGDAVLDLVGLQTDPQRAQLFFMIGLGLFLVGHVFYISGLLWRFSAAWRWQGPALGALVLWGATVLAWVWPLPPDLMPAVLVYMLVILAMAALAMLRQPVQPLLVGGALVFVLSDSLIAINTFGYAGKLPWAHLAIMVTYYAAQYMVARGALAIQPALAVQPNVA